MSAPADVGATAARFVLSGQLRSAEAYGSGHINDSFLLVYDHDGGTARYLLQRLNRRVLTRPDLVMENVARVCAHLSSRLEHEDGPDASRRVMTLVPTRSGASHLTDAAGDVWRVYVFIEGTHFPTATGASQQARETGRAFGRFQRLLADYAGPTLHETIPHFHDTPGRFEALERAIADDASGRVAEADAEIDAARSRRKYASALADAQNRGRLPVRIVHNDAKADNVLFDDVSGEGLCVVDLDTVMPGLALSDFGDMARSLVSACAEDEPDLDRVHVRLDVFEALARGYLEAAGDMLVAAERELLVRSAQVITLEQAVRFLTDHLEGDAYYRLERPGQNLARARTQLRLLEELEKAEPDLESIAARI